YYAIVLTPTTFKVALTPSNAALGVNVTLTGVGTGTITETPISDGEILTKMPVQIIQTIVENPDVQLKGNYYHYDIVDDRLHHTRTKAVIDVVTFSASDIRTSLSATLNDANVAPIPDACLDMAWTGLVSTLFIDDEFPGASANVRAVFRELFGRDEGGSSF